MLQYVLTAIAGIALGIVGMRVWQAREAQAAGADSATPDSGTTAAPPAGTRKLLIGAGVLAAAAIAVFALRSQDDATRGGPAGLAPAAPGSGQALDDVDTMIARLAERLEKNPKDGDGFRMLGWSYVMTGRPEKAIEPYRRALALLPDRAAVHAGYGEALVGVAKGAVTPQAKGAFDKAISLDPTEPRARYFLALWQAQHGQEKEALENWIGLANSGPADAPWQSELRSKISETSTKLGIDVSSRLKNAGPAASGAEPPPIDPAAMQAASRLPASDRQAMIDGMVEGLAAKLKANPKDADRWVLLLRSRMVLKQGEQAGRDLAAARQALAGDGAALRKINAAASEFGVPGA